MKTAIVYFSLEGNTEYVAKKIAQIMGDCDLIKLETEKDYYTEGWKKMLLNGRDAMKGDTPELKPFQFNVSEYDKILLGSPIWASRMAPAMKTFIEMYGGDIVEKGPENIGVFFSQSGNGYKSTFKRMRKELGVKRVGAELSMVDPAKHPEDAVAHFEKIAIFCSQMINGRRRRSRIIR